MTNERRLKRLEARLHPAQEECTCKTLDMQRDGEREVCIFPGCRRHRLARCVVMVLIGVSLADL